MTGVGGRSGKAAGEQPAALPSVDEDGRADLDHVVDTLDVGIGQADASVAYRAADGVLF
jgi:hypothetical protein